MENEKPTNEYGHEKPTELQMADFLMNRGIDSMEKLQELFEPHYFVVIPIEILERKDLSPNGKLLYGEISALTKRHGYCIATDKYLGQRLCIKQRTIRKLMLELESKELIIRDTNKSAKGTYRRIYLTWRCPPVGKNVPTPRHKESHQEGMNVPTKREIDKEKLKKESESVAASFEKFWAAYPNKKAKKLAFQKWIQIRPSPELAEKIIGAVEAFKKTDQWKRDKGRFIPHPATYLNQERWEDELKVDSPKTSGGKFESVKSTKV